MSKSSRAIKTADNKAVQKSVKIFKVFTFNIYALCHKYNFTFVKISERRCKMRKPKDFEKFIPATLSSGLPVVEIKGNREITVEGSTGVLKYEQENIKINTKMMVISVNGRNLKLKYLSSSSLIIEGTFLSLEYIM